MSQTNHISELGPLAALRQFVRRPQQSEHVSCELCSGALTPDHQHLLELGKRNIVCACDACSLLFSNSAAPRFRRIPRRLRVLTDFRLDDHQWGSLLIPIQLAFFFHSSSARRVLSYYPSPAGATESLLDLEYWDEVVAQNPVLQRMESDVEALLVNRVSTPAEYYLAPIDHCYRLVGVIRKNWRGLSGGKEVWKQIDLFFSDLKQTGVPHPSRREGAPATGAARRSA